MLAKLYVSAPTDTICTKNSFLEENDPDFEFIELYRTCDLLEGSFKSSALNVQSVKEAEVRDIAIAKNKTKQRWGEGRGLKEKSREKRGKACNKRSE